MNQPSQEPPSFATQAVHFVRTATIVNLTLSQMADQKASILMGATFVVFTLAVGQASAGSFPLSLLVLACFSFLAALFAVAVVLPSFRPVRSPPGRENILFFGVFSQMAEDEFVDQVMERLAADDTMFRTMLRDVYQNGQVLQRKKYRFLGLAYRTFLTGLVVTLMTFLFENREMLASLF
jgi:hypothetical protein